MELLMNPVLRRRALGPLSLAAVWPFSPSAMSAPRRVDLQGHRGARGLAPENTLEGLHVALAQGVTTNDYECRPMFRRTS